MWTHNRLPGLENVGIELRKIKAVAQLDQGADGIEPHFAVGIDKAKVPHLHEAGWEHVLQETPDELQDIEGHGSPPGAFGFLVAKGDGSILHLENVPPLAGLAMATLKTLGARYLRLAALAPTAWQLTFHSVSHTSTGISPSRPAAFISSRNLARKILERALTGR